MAPLLLPFFPFLLLLFLFLFFLSLSFFFFPFLSLSLLPSFPAAAEVALAPDPVLVALAAAAVPLCAAAPASGMVVVPLVFDPKSALPVPFLGLSETLVEEELPLATTGSGLPFFLLLMEAVAAVAAAGDDGVPLKVNSWSSPPQLAISRTLPFTARHCPLAFSGWKVKGSELVPLKENSCELVTWPPVRCETDD